MSIRAITFDFWCTLFRDKHSEKRHALRVDALCEATGANRDAASDALHEVQREFLRSHIEDQRTLTPRHAVDITCERLDATLDEAEIDHLARVFGEAVVRFSPVPIDGAVEAVEAAAARAPIGIVSDTGMSPGSSLRELLRRHGLFQHFGTLVFSNEVGVAKPQAAMFERAAEALGVAPSELLHIGDLEPTDIVGIRRLGGTGALFAGDNNRFADTTTADITFSHWREFVAWLKTADIAVRA